jgi:hypothetical protein
MNRTKLIAFIAVICLLSSVPTASAGYLDKYSPYGSVLVSVLYVTDRALSANVQSDDPRADARRVEFKKRLYFDTNPNGSGRLTYGWATVWVPATKDMVANSSLKPEYAGMQWIKDYKSAADSCYKPELNFVGYPDNPINKVSSNFDERALNGAVAARFANPSLAVPREVLVYVHGYASSWRNAVYTSALLSLHLKRPVVCYSWPSAATMSAHDYNRNDVPMVEQEGTLDRFISWLGRLNKAANDGGIRTSVVAHSLGNRLVSEGFVESSAARSTPLYPKLQRFISLAPDVTVKYYGEHRGAYADCSETMFLFINPHDKALLGAKWVSSKWKFQTRLGAAGIAFETTPEIRQYDYQDDARGGVQHYIDFARLAELLDH